MTSGERIAATAERRTATTRLGLAVVLAALCIAPAAAFAQGIARTDTAHVIGPDGRVRVVRTISVTRPAAAVPGDGAATLRPFAPLDTRQLRLLRAARAEREAGHLDQAADSLATLLAELPHHPLVVTEQARLQLQRKQYAEIERLGRFERYNQKDSVLLGYEMVEALERLDRPRDAARVAIETWVAAPDRRDWAHQTLIRLLPSDPRGIQDLLQRAVTRFPERSDLVRTLILVAWRNGNVDEAIRVAKDSDHDPSGTPLRWILAEEMLQVESFADSTAALETLLDLAGDPNASTIFRMSAARRAWRIHELRKTTPEAAQRILAAFSDIAPQAWQPDLLIAVARELRRSGHTAEARALLDPNAAAGRVSPELALERALADLRDGPPERALHALGEIGNQLPEAAFRYAEALFYSGMSDSALACYGRIAEDPTNPFAGASLDRIYLIEDAGSNPALATFAHIAYEEWRDDPKEARAMAESLYQELPRGPLWSRAALILSDQLEAAGKLQEAIAPALAVADSLPEDRLASRARQQAGDLFLAQGDEANAMKQYEECLARYPRAWNAPEVRRILLKLRKEFDYEKMPETPSTAS